MKKEGINELEKKWTELLKGPKRVNEPNVRKSPISAAELQGQLLEDELFQKWLKEKDEVRSMLQSLYRKEEEPLIEDLAKIGIHITSIWDLANTNKSYAAAIPVLINHLPLPYHIKTKEGIARALTVKEAKGIACKVVLTEYLSTDKAFENYRWVLGNTMAVIMTSEYTEDVIKIVQDKSNGISRNRFVLALGKVNFDKVEAVLMELLDDDEMAPYAIDILRNKKSIKAKEKIEILSQHKNELIRKAAQKFLKKLEAN